jgi:hypothetical protein
MLREVLVEIAFPVGSDVGVAEDGKAGQFSLQLIPTHPST